MGVSHSILDHLLGPVDEVVVAGAVSGVDREGVGRKAVVVNVAGHGVVSGLRLRGDSLSDAMILA